MLKLQIFSPGDTTVIRSLIAAAASAGAGKMGNYTQCAYIARGNGTWKPEEGAHPAVGKVGEVSYEPEVKIEKHCAEEYKEAVYAAVKKAHPYEEPAIEFIALEPVESTITK